MEEGREDYQTKHPRKATLSVINGEDNIKYHGSLN